MAYFAYLRIYEHGIVQKISLTIMLLVFSLDFIEHNNTLFFLAFGAAAVAGSSSSASHSFIDYSKTIRFLRFDVEYRDRNVNLDVQDNDTVGLYLSMLF